MMNTNSASRVRAACQVLLASLQVSLFASLSNPAWAQSGNVSGRVFSIEAAPDSSLADAFQLGDTIRIGYNVVPGAIDQDPSSAVGRYVQSHVTAVSLDGTGQSWTTGNSILDKVFVFDDVTNLFGFGDEMDLVSYSLPPDHYPGYDTPITGSSVGGRDIAQLSLSFYGPASMLTGDSVPTPPFAYTRGRVNLVLWPGDQEVGLWFFPLAGAPPEPPDDDRTIGILLERHEVWANGHEEVGARVTVEGTDAHGRLVTLEADPSIGVRIDPPEVVTDSSGVANFSVSSTSVGHTVITAADSDDESLVASAEINFVRRRVVVLVPGINSELFQDGDQSTFPLLRHELYRAGFVRPLRGEPEEGSACGNALDDDSDGAPNDGCPMLLNYSYNGGEYDVDGMWLSYPFTCEDTAGPLGSSIRTLVSTAREFSNINPNTEFIFIGHSQGGFVALHALRDLGRGGVVVSAVVTLDGVLGGTPPLPTGIAANFSCWGDPAARHLARVWRSAFDHSRQGTTAIVRGRRVSQLVADSQRRGVRVMTIGSSDDCVMNPRRCFIAGRDNSSTQVVEGADVSMLLPLGGNCGPTCVEFSHLRVLNEQAVVDAIVEFVGSPVD